MQSMNLNDAIIGHLPNPGYLPVSTLQLNE